MLVFVRWNIGISVASVAVAGLVVLALAWMSYRFVETPIRQSRSPLATRILPVTAIMLALVGGALGIASRTQGTLYVGQPFIQADWLPSMDTPYASSGAVTGRACLLTAGRAVPDEVPAACRTRSDTPDRDRTVLLVGDSHAFSQFGLLGALEAVPGLSGAALVHDGCNWYRGDDHRPLSCATYLAQVPDLIRATVSAGDVVLLASFFPFDGFTEAEFHPRLAAVNAAAVEVGARLVLEVPHIRSGTRAILCTREWFRTAYDGCSIAAETLRQNRAAIVDSLTRMAAAQPVPPLLWDPLDELCPGDICAAVGPDGPVLRDGNHLAARASRALAGPFVDFLAAAGLGPATSTD